MSENQSLVLVHDVGRTTLDPGDLSAVDGEPRILDLTLAERLGFKRAHDIRELITRNQDELAAYGEVCATVAQTGGRPGREFWLNEAQALLLCMFSRTAAAAGVRKQVIEVFTAWRRGQEVKQARVEAARHRREVKPITADDIADAEPVLRISEHVLGRRLCADWRGLIDDYKAELVCLGSLRFAGRRHRHHLLTEGQALRLCMVSGDREAGVVANEITEAFAEHRRRQADEYYRQQQTVTALMSEVTTMRAALTHYAEQTPINDRLARIEAAVGSLKLGKDEVQAAVRLLGLDARQAQTLSRWLGARVKPRELTEAQERWRRGYHARKGGEGRS